MTAREQLHEKLLAEYSTFIKGLKNAEPDKIIESAYEKVIKEDMLVRFDHDGEFSEEELTALLALENPLHRLYRNWFNNDMRYTDDLRESISGFVERRMKQREMEVKAAAFMKARKTEIPNNSEPLKARVINGEVRVGDYVITAPLSEDYGYLAGQVTAIEKLGTPEHNTDNPFDDIHVNFHYFNYPPWQKVDFENHFAELAGDNYVPFDELPLRDVIVLPETLISLAGTGIEKIKVLVADYEEAEKFCESVITASQPERSRILMQRIDRNLEEYRRSLMDFGIRDIIDKAGEINAVNSVHTYLSKYAYQLSHGELDFFLQFESPLKIIADAWKDSNADLSGLRHVIYHIRGNIDDYREYPLMRAYNAPKQSAAEPGRKSKPLTLKGQLVEKLAVEYDSFLAELKTVPPGKIIESAYEKVMKEDLAQTVENRYFSDEELTVMLSQDGLLDTLYQDWIHSDLNYMDTLTDCVDESVDVLVHDAQQEQPESEQQEEAQKEPPPQPKAQAVSREPSLLDEVREAAREIEAKKGTQPAAPTKKQDRGIE